MAMIYNPPDTQRMEALLFQERDTVSGLILCLAWRAGLSRQEIHSLQWCDIDLDREVIRLADREVPIQDEALSCLRDRKTIYKKENHSVLNWRKTFTLQYITILSHAALTRAGLPNVRLVDLRHDYIIRQLKEHDWKYVARVAGITKQSIDTRYMAFIEKAPTPTPEHKTPMTDFTQVEDLLAQETGSPIGTILRLVWLAGLSADETQKLTWSQVDFVKEQIVLQDRSIFIVKPLLDYLTDLHKKNGAESEYVLLSIKSRKPLERSYIFKLAKDVFVRAGMDDLRLLHLRKDYERRQKASGDDTVLDHIKSKGYATRADVMRWTNRTELAASQCLKRLVGAGELTAIDLTYYPTGKVAPKEQHEALVLAFLSRHGSAANKDIVELLHITRKQVLFLLKKLISAEKVTVRNNRYYLNTSAPDR